MDNKNNTDEHFDDMYDEAKGPAKKTAKMTGKAVGKRAIKALIKAIAAGIKLIFAFFGWFIIPILIIGILSYFIIFEFQGTEKEYSRDHENELEINEEGIALTKEDGVKAENIIIQDFYKFWAGQSFYQIVGDDKKLRKPDDDNAVSDRYNREDNYILTPNFLYTLDRDVYGKAWKHPEQFIKPVHYDEDKLLLKDLTDEDKQRVVAKSKEIDMKTGKETGKEVDSVKDYGLGTVLAYNQTEDWYEYEILKGYYDSKEVWDSESESVVTVPIEPEYFEEELSKTPIYLIEKIINFKETREIQYEYQETKLRGLGTGDPREDKAIKYSSHRKPSVIDDITGLVVSEGETIVLKKNRSSDSAVFQKIPVPLGGNNSIVADGDGNAEIDDKQELNEEEDKEIKAKREKMIEESKKLVGKVPYFWGGKSKAGWNDEWNKPKKVTAAGNKNTGKEIPFGLDCSGFIDWAYKTGGFGNVLSSGGTTGQWNSSHEINRSDLIIGDLAFKQNPSIPGVNHTGIYVGKNDKGEELFIHSSSSRKGVTITNSAAGGFKQFRRVNELSGGDINDTSMNIIDGSAGTVVENDNRDYLQDYLAFFESDVPVDTINDFIFKDRIDYDSYVFNNDGTLIDGKEFELGSRTEESKFENTMQHMPLIKKAADEFGTDPYVILAQLTLESGGNPNMPNGNGISQITGSFDLNVKNANGQNVKLSINQALKRDVEHSIRFATAYHKSFLDKYDNDVYKAITAYNQGPGGMEKIKSLSGSKWNNGLEWLPYREEARIYWGKRELGVETRSANYDYFDFPTGRRTKANYPRVYGNSNYLEMVLCYYPKEGQTDITYNSKDVQDGLLKSSAKSLGNLFMSFVRKFEKDEDIEHEFFSKEVKEDFVNDILLGTASFDNEVLFSEAGYEGVNLTFWQEGFKDDAGMNAGGDISGAGLNSTSQPNPEGFIVPLPPGFRISSDFNPGRKHPIHGTVRAHNGTDMAAPTGTKVYASKAGKITKSGWWGSGGNTVMIDHGNGIETYYLHLNKSHVKVGDNVQTGQHIADVGSTGGSTGPHLHFEYRVNGKAYDAINIVKGKSLSPDG